MFEIVYESRGKLIGGSLSSERKASSRPSENEGGDNCVGVNTPNCKHSYANFFKGVVFKLNDYMHFSSPVYRPNNDIKLEPK